MSASSKIMNVLFLNIQFGCLLSEELIPSDISDLTLAVEQAAAQHEMVIGVGETSTSKACIHAA